MYEITYTTETTPITLEINAPDPYTACYILGKKSKTKPTSKIIRIIHRADPEVIFQTST